MNRSKSVSQYSLASLKIFFGDCIAEASWMFKSTHHASGDRVVSVAKISGEVAPWHVTF